jgi:hypothetical protein
MRDANCTWCASDSRRSICTARTAELRPQHFLEFAEPLLTQRVHAGVAIEVRIDQGERPGIVERVSALSI